MRNGSVYLKSLFCLPALLIVLFFSSCQKTSTTSSSDTGDWAKEVEFSGVPRTQAASFTIHYTTGSDTVYVGGGYNNTSNTRLNDFYKFDETNGWTRIADFPGVPRNGAVGFSINGKGYIGTGSNGTTTLSDFWEYDPTTNSWDSVASPFPGVSRSGAVAFALNNTGYVGTGLDSFGNWNNDFYAYTATNGWSQSAPIKQKRTGASAFVFNNQAYVVGGVQNGGYLPDLNVYNATANKWTNNRDINDINDSSYDALYGNNITRSNAAVFLINDTAYLATGNYNGIMGTTWAYDITNDQWFVKTAFEGSAREGAIGFNVNNHGYITTGDNGSTYFDDTWQFFPNVTQTVNDNQ